MNMSLMALLGRKDSPTDGVEDYCNSLGRALAPHGVELTPVRVNWAEEGWFRALRKLCRRSFSRNSCWAVVQYTALAWSQRGFPFLVLAVLWLLHVRGARCAVVFHEPHRQSGGKRLLDRIRGSCQDWVIHRLYSGAEKAVFTTSLDNVAWLRHTNHKASFIPIGANIPERMNARLPTPPDNAKTVIIFGVTGAPTMMKEVDAIHSVMVEARTFLPGIRLVMLGRGSVEAKTCLAAAFPPMGVEVIAKGVLPAEQIASEIEAADAFLFLRGAVTPGRGSALAAIACGLPIIGYGNGQVEHPLDEAGVEWAPIGDTRAMAQGLVRVLSDRGLWLQLRQRNLEVHRKYFSWNTIAKQYLEVFYGYAASAQNPGSRTDGAARNVESPAGMENRNRILP